MRFGEHDVAEYASYVANVRAALEWAFSAHGDVNLGVELAISAAPLFIGLSLLEECGRWCERALAGLDPAARGTRQEMILQEALALSLMYTTGNSDQVRAAIERGLALEETLGDHRHRQQLLFLLFRILMRLGDFRGALAVARQSATFAEDAKDPASLLIADSKLCVCHHFIGDQAAAQFFGERAITRAAEPGTLIDDFFGFFGFDYRIYAPIMLARAMCLRGFAAQACRLAKTAIDDTLCRVNPLSICVSLSNGSSVFLWSGDFHTAENYAERLIAYAGRHSLEPYRAAGLGLKGAGDLWIAGSIRRPEAGAVVISDAPWAGQRHTASQRPPGTPLAHFWRLGHPKDHPWLRRCPGPAAGLLRNNGRHPAHGHDAGLAGSPAHLSSHLDHSGSLRSPKVGDRRPASAQVVS